MAGDRLAVVGGWLAVVAGGCRGWGGVGGGWRWLAVLVVVGGTLMVVDGG